MFSYKLDKIISKAEDKRLAQACTLPPDCMSAFNELCGYPFSPKFQQFVSLYEEPKRPSLENFIVGIQKFTEIANLKIDARSHFFGSPYYGMHYRNNLTDLWNRHSEKKIKSYHLMKFSPVDWQCIYQKPTCVLTYHGDKPAEALNRLLRGPTVIDCGMFSQLSIWFGIRYILGDVKFNQVFGHRPFHVTQFIDDKVKNPLHPLFDKVPKKIQLEKDDIEIVTVNGYFFYSSKHAAGEYEAENCIAINGGLTIFDQTAPITAGLQVDDVKKILVGGYNLPPDQNDVDMLELYAEIKWGDYKIDLKAQGEIPEEIEEDYEYLYPNKERLALERERHLSSRLSDRNNQINVENIGGLVGQIQFNFAKFLLWSMFINHQYFKISRHLIPEFHLCLSSILKDPLTIQYEQKRITSLLNGSATFFNTLASKKNGSFEQADEDSMAAIIVSKQSL